MLKSVGNIDGIYSLDKNFNLENHAKDPRLGEVSQ
jgi:hypothetical protein